MKVESLADWLQWQESLNPREIELGLERVGAVARRLSLRPPTGAVFIVAGTNGKGSCVHLLEQALSGAGRKTGAYTSPHLVYYNERIRVDGISATDDVVVSAFEQIEAVRDGEQLTYFEYGTLAALAIFSGADCDAWILEVGMGGRLDAVNTVDADFSLVTTIGLDHEDWLGESIDQIAGEKAGIMRRDKPAFFGDRPVPAVIREQAARLDAPLLCLGDDFDYSIGTTDWQWRGPTRQLDGLPLPPGRGEDQIRNISLVLAVLDQYDSALLSPVEPVRRWLTQNRLPGRFQVLNRNRQWILDVAHNQQAAAALVAKLETLGPASSMTIVLGMMADKRPETFVGEFADQVDQWITCTVDYHRGSTGVELADRIQSVMASPVEIAASVEKALQKARQVTPLGGRVLVCGSFHVVGPALRWLGLY
jgi:dihydrofolate synthase/folylpolyglutamate synthase